MKRTYLTYLTFACMLGTFTSCTQNEMPEAGGDTAGTEESAVQRIGIQLASDNGNDGLARAGRPLYSNQPAQMVDKVALVICNDANQVVVCKLVDDWETVSEVYETSGHGRKAVIELNEGERLPATSATYTLYAIGYTSREGNQTAYTVKISELKSKTLDVYLSELNKGDTFAPNLVLHLEDEPGEEIFAGSVSFTTYASGGFDNTVVLNRQVAGTYVYVEDVPYVEGASILRLTASADNDGLVLGEFANEDIAENGKDTGKYVMNGTSQKSSGALYTVCEIDLSQWMRDGEIHRDGTLVAVDNYWKIPSQYDGKATFKKGSFYSGSFLIPFAAVSGRQSLTLGLYNKESDSKSVKTWNVNLSQSDVNKQSNVIWHWDSSKFQNPSETTPVAESQNSYSVLRNHLYCIGRRDKDNLENSDKDEPQALEDVTELIIKVIADWDVVYDMILEPEPSQF